jgi:hypothetical protein
MFDALRVAYGELSQTRPASAAAVDPSVDVSFTFEGEGAPSLVVDVAFGAEHEDAVARERSRTRDVLEALSEVSVATDLESPHPAKPSRSGS